MYRDSKTGLYVQEHAWESTFAAHANSVEMARRRQETNPEKERMMNGLEIAVNMVREFCDKVGVSPKTKLVAPKDARGENSALDGAEMQLSRLSHKLLMYLDRPRANRAHLMVEELSEVIAAMREGDEVKTLDGLTDLLYVVLGTASTFDLPIAAAFAEVHRSNMTKERQPTERAEHPRGPNYSPPDLEGELREHREGGAQ